MSVRRISPPSFVGAVAIVAALAAQHAATKIKALIEKAGLKRINMFINKEVKNG